VQTYTYDSLGRLSTIQDVFSPIFTYTYDKDGRVSEVSSGSFGLAEHRQYDLEGRLASTVDSTKDTSSTSGTGSAVLHSNVYHYDARGNAIETDATQEVSHNNYSALGTMVHGIILPQPGPLKYVFDLDEEIYLPDAFGNAQWKWATTSPSNDSLANAQHLYYHAHTGRLDSATYHTTNQQINPPQSHYQSALFDHAGNRWFNTFQDSPNDVDYNVGATVSYYDAGNRLRVADRQTCFYDASVPSCVTNEQNLPFTEETRYEDYYYDALGRRVLLRSRDDVITPCIVNATPTHPGCFGAIERTVYDGNQVLYEIRMPGDDSVPAAELERDTGGVATYVGHDYLTPYGRVVYLHGLDLDDPLDIIRVGQDSSWPGPVAVAPRTNWRGAYDGGVFTLPHPGSQFLCKDYGSGHNGESCFSQTWPAPRFGYWRQDQGNNSNMAPDPWIGSLVTGHRDVSNLLYLRNRYFDPQSQTFTQEDPAGLAGGLNAYGFAHGDPVNYADPFGLAYCIQRGNCTQSDGGEGDIEKLKEEGARDAMEPAGPSVADIAMLTIPGAEEAKLGEEVVATAVEAGGRRSAAVATEGIYEFTAASGKTYVGQSGNIAARIAQHLRSGKLLAADASSVRTTEVLGGKTAREVAEQVRINQLGGILKLENKVNPIGPARSHLLPPP
jgi:RHS repeat-associated protein